MLRTRRDSFRIKTVIEGSCSTVHEPMASGEQSGGFGDGLNTFGGGGGGASTSEQEKFVTFGNLYPTFQSGYDGLHLRRVPA